MPSSAFSPRTQKYEKKCVKKKSSQKSFDFKLLFSADGGGRTHTVLLPIDFEFLSSSSIWCHPVISSDIWFPLCKGKIHASTNNNLKYPRFFDAFFLYSVFSVWTAQMEIGGMFRRDAGQNAPLLRHKTKGKSRIMNQNQAKEYYKKLFVNYPDVLSVEEATTLPKIQLRPPSGLPWAQPVGQRCNHAESGWEDFGALCGQHRLQGTDGVSG